MLSSNNNLFLNYIYKQFCQTLVAYIVNISVNHFPSKIIIKKSTIGIILIFDSTKKHL